MARKSVVNRNDKRKRMIDKFRAQRELLRARASNIHLPPEERWQAGQDLQALPRDSSPARYRRRCQFCKRSRANNRLTGLCRLHMRIITNAGMIPGMHKASW